MLISINFILAFYLAQRQQLIVVALCTISVKIGYNNWEIRDYNGAVFTPGWQQCVTLVYSDPLQAASTHIDGREE